MKSEMLFFLKYHKMQLEGVESEETVEEQETSIIQESPLEELSLDLDSLEEVQEQLDKTQEEVIEKEKQKVLELEIERE